MSLSKGLAIIGGTIAGGAALAASAPVLTVTAPLWGILGTTYTINGVSLAGAAACTAAGAGIGKIAGQTGGALVIQGLDDASQKLIDRINVKKTS
ncbi:exported hypothetical protein [Desulfamplus magnetovallimortis]|uniref:Uncharacterized protein n=1 Tax=Desulfamplus magnetovallimortis TaxID=1246637 RepID=A0A1W1HF02_9BACT|nr:hypothetical protein [Desulfamplus magnetovallimortis]SLM30955.1 exported hypothetical protein [Desulfamplus magnetovallimortis]